MPKTVEVKLSQPVMRLSTEFHYTLFFRNLIQQILYKKLDQAFSGKYFISHISS